MYFVPSLLFLSLLRTCNSLGAPRVPGSSAYMRGSPEEAAYEKERLGYLRGNLEHDREFDYIVLGGGTAGNAVGVRLAEAGHRVAIVEAGSLYEKKDNGIHAIPGRDNIGVGSSHSDAVASDVDWKFKTEPQPGADYRRVPFARGRCLGGSSALNFMIYHRGSKGTYDSWANCVGDDSYKFDSFNGFFKKSVTGTPPNYEKRKHNASSTRYYATDFAPRGKGGPVNVSYPQYVSAWATWLERGFKAVGIKRTDGYNRGDLMGYHYTTSTINPEDATRSSSANYVYWARGKELRNLKVFLRTHALKVLFDDQKKAVGAKVDYYGKTFTLKARKEVVVSAGAFQSPQLLMVSGVGPSETLRHHKIPVLSHLPGVGQNMWDHIFFGPSSAVKIPTLNELAHPDAQARAINDYYKHKTGPLTSNSIELLAWEKIPKHLRRNFSPLTEKKLAEFPEDWPEVEYLSAGGFLGNFSSPSKWQPRDGRNYASTLGALVAPLSRGNITIRSASALDAPIISPNWLEDKGDQELAVAWYRRMREVWASKPLNYITDGSEYYPGAYLQSDEEVLSIIRKSVMTIWHPACTCKMGTKDDKMAVLDSRARVYGVSGLRVVDASAMPILPPGHPQSTIYALAEKIAYHMIHGEKKGYHTEEYDGESKHEGGYGGEKGDRHQEYNGEGVHEGEYGSGHRQEYGGEVVKEGEYPHRGGDY